MQTGVLLTIQTGRVREMELAGGHPADDQPNTWSSGIFKAAVTGPVRISAAGIDGDEQSDLENHGGPDNVVLAYDAAHYPMWRERLGMRELGHGGFGENFTVSGFSDEDVCIGDVWGVGTGPLALKLEVTQSRQPCFKLARRIGMIEIVGMVRESGWGGWYLRVLREGVAEAGMAISLVERRHAEWPVAKAVQVMYARRREREPARELARLPELSKRWRQQLFF